MRGAVTFATPPGPQVQARRSIYDLATVAADYPPWPGAPRRTVVVCSHPRSGSTLLGEAMYFAGGLGCPIEYFHRGFRPALEQVWGSGEVADYVRQVHRRRTDPTGTLGVKLFWIDVLDLCEQRFPDQADLLKLDLDKDEQAAREVYALVGTLFAEIFPNPAYVWLSRKDRLRGAVSHCIASQTRVWRRIPSVDDHVPLREPEYDYETISSLYGSAAYCTARWDGLFRSLCVSPHRLAYEDLAGGYEATVRGLLVAVGESATQRVRPTRVQRQASALSERFVARFLRDYAERAARART